MRWQASCCCWARPRPNNSGGHFVHWQTVTPPSRNCPVERLVTSNVRLGLGLAYAHSDVSRARDPKTAQPS